MINKIILLFGILFLIGVVSSEVDTQLVSDTFKLNEQVNYRQGCWNNGTFCSAAAVCNFSVYKPNGLILINNTQGQNNRNNHNITFWVSDLGNYRIDMNCCDGASGCGSESFYAQVTGSGQNNNDMVYIIVLIVLGSLIGLGFYLSDGSFVILGGFGLTIFSLFILLNGISVVQNKELTWGIGLIMLFSGTYLGIRSSWEMYESLD